MFRIILLMLLPIIHAMADELPSPLPDTLYFSTNWCPNDNQLAELSKLFELTMNGCCIQRATPLPQTISNPEILAPWKKRIYLFNSDIEAPCVGLTKEQELQVKLQAQIEKDEFRKAEDQRISELPALLMDMTEDRFCVAYGRAIRVAARAESIGTIMGPWAAKEKKLVKNEASRRKLKLYDSLVKAMEIRLGISECQLYASVGIPDKKERTVDRLGVHVVLVFLDIGNGIIVQTENGKVSKWHD